VTEGPALTRTLQAAALCLDYPDDAMLEAMSLVSAALPTLPVDAADHLRRFVAYASGTEAAELRRRYVETFDLQRRCCLYLTYYTFGDTRKRGMAVLAFTEVYRRVGVVIADGELPDHLAVLCEVTARHPSEGLELFRLHRAGLELLRMALAATDSPYLDVIDAVRAVLPDAPPRDLQRAIELAASGPPAEEVGLEPFAPPEISGARR
jgi:nitrate reductase delta subunit